MGTLHVVATPIGHLEDVTLRSLRVLAEADLVYAEDTRRTRVLLDRHGIAARLVSLNAQNEAKRIGEALDRLAADDARVALVTDAGTPVVSDPGGRLVAAAADAGHRIEPIPGASAVLAALSACGLRVTTFSFLGFPPRRAGARRRLFAEHALREPALVFFESPNRLLGTLTDLAGVTGAARRACVARELTKLHEEIVRGSLDELLAHFADGVRGEVTVVVEGADPAVQTEDAGHAIDEATLDEAIRGLADSGRRAREIAAELAARTGLPRRDIYARAAALLAGRSRGGSGADEA